MYICANRPSADKLIRLRYSTSECVESVEELKHDIAKACFKRTGISSRIEVASLSDIPAGSGLGSSSTYAVGLLNALYSIKVNIKSLTKFLIHEACTIENGYLPQKIMGKQDQYLSHLIILRLEDIDKNGVVVPTKIKLEKSIMNELNRNLLIFYTGQQRKNNKILSEQDKVTKNNDKEMLDSSQNIKQSDIKF